MTVHLHIAAFCAVTVLQKTRIKRVLYPELVWTLTHELVVTIQIVMGSLFSLVLSVRTHYTNLKCN